MVNLEFCDTYNMVVYLEKPKGSEGFYQIVDFFNPSHIRNALRENPTIYVSLINQFWETATARTLDNGEIEIIATIDGKVKIVTEASVRRHLKLADSDGLIVQGEGSTVPVESYHIPTAYEAVSTSVDVRHGGAATTITSLDVGQGSDNINKTPSMLHDSPLPRVHTLRSDEGKMQHNELMDLVTKLSDRVVALEIDLEQTKKVYGATYTKIIKKVKKLVQKDTLKKSGRKLRLMGAQTHGRYGQDMEYDTRVFDTTTVGAEISTANPEVKTVGVSVDDTAAKTLVYNRRSEAKAKDKCKAVKLQEELDEEERQRIARVHEAACSFIKEEREDIKARVKADEELVQRLQTEEKQKYIKDEQAKMLVDLINKRKRYFAAQRTKAKRNKPMTQAQQRTYMSNYIKHMTNYKLQQLKKLSFDEIKDLFEITMRRVNTFVPIETEVRRGVPELVANSSKAVVREAGGTKRDVEEELGHESSKNKKSGDESLGERGSVELSGVITSFAPSIEGGVASIEGDESLGEVLVENVLNVTMLRQEKTHSVDKVIKELWIISHKDNVININHKETSDILVFIEEEGRIGQRLLKHKQEKEVGELNVPRLRSLF
nr:hypothetical protein [Tanacetum cinerariifolium]